MHPLVQQNNVPAARLWLQKVRVILRPWPGWTHEVIVIVARWWLRRPASRIFLEGSRPGRDEGREVVAMPVGVKGVLAFAVGAQGVLQLAINVGVVGVEGESTGIGDSFRVRIEPLHNFIIRVALLEPEAFLHFHVNASLL